MKLFPLLGAVAIMLSSCDRKASPEDLCTRFFEPYPDLVTGRVIVGHQLPLLNGMEAYTAGDHASAVELLQTHLRAANHKKYAHLYLANSYLALGKPYEAELHLDHLERSNLGENYRDQTEWYTVLCWLCSGQLDRAQKGARDIAEGRRHTYKKQARELVEALAGS